MLAYNQDDGSTGYYPVTDVIQNEDQKVTRLTIGGDTVDTTPEHPFYTDEKGWVDAGALWTGAHVRQADGSSSVVEQVTTSQTPTLMYNLTVAGAHTFFVGDEKWLVHNARCIVYKIGPGGRFKGLIEVDPESEEAMLAFEMKEKYGEIYSDEANHTTFAQGVFKNEQPAEIMVNGTSPIADPKKIGVDVANGRLHAEDALMKKYGGNLKYIAVSQIPCEECYQNLVKNDFFEVYFANYSVPGKNRPR